ncbi:MAG: choice-of-anchor D domain-containing protein [Nibricoccus sp.]
MNTSVTDSCLLPPTPRLRALSAFVWVLLSFTLLALLPSLEAAQTVSVSKTCMQGQPATVSGNGTFTISTAQTIEWAANYTPGSPCNGNDFYLHTNPGNLTEIALTTNGTLSGTHFLNPGTYTISITYFGMGGGSYSVTFDRTATIGLSPASHNFGHELENDSSSDKTISVTKTGDLDVNSITAAVEGADAAFFSLSALPPSNDNAPASFKVKFNAGTISGSATQVVRNAVVRVKGVSSPAGTPVPDVLLTVQGTTDKRVPDIKYQGTNPAAVKANHVMGEAKAFTARIKNAGTQSLTFTSAITLVNDTAPGVFALSGVPSIAALNAGATRDIALTFTPPPTATQDQVFAGHLVVNSNDPDEPVLLCNFTATAHEPRPKIRIEPQNLILDYREVEVGFSYDLGVIVHNDGDAPLVFDMAEVDPADPDRPQWSAINAPTAVTVAPGDSSVQRQTFTPTVVGGPYMLSLTVAGTNHPTLPPPATVLLTGKCIPPIPLNSVLVLDRSGSMNESAGPFSKITALGNAASIWTSLLRLETPANPGLGDAMGLVKYNNTNQEYKPLQLLTTAHRDDILNNLDAAALGDIARLKPDDATGIGGGMQRGADMLKNNLLEAAGTPSRKHVLVVMTDGIENRTPWILDVLPDLSSADSRLKIYSLGLGEQLDIGKLQSITNQSPDHGFHQVSGDLVGAQRFDLNTFYFKIFVDSIDWQLVVDPTFAVNLGSTAAQLVDTAEVCSSDLSAIFLIMDEPGLRPYYDLHLIDPNNNVIVVGASVGGVPVQVSERDNYRIVKVIFPDPAFASSYVGEWKLMIVPNGKWKPRTPGAATHDNTPSGGNDPVFNGYNGLVPVGFGAAVASNYRLNASAIASPNYEPGATVTLTADLSDRGWPSVTGTVTVDATKPDGSSVNGITLYDDGTHGDVAASDGTWTAKFGQTSQQGSYKFFFNAIGKNDRGELAPRQATRYVSLTPPPRNPPGDGGNGRPGDDGRGDGCIPCPLLKWLWRIVIGLLVLIVILLLRRRP